MTEATEYEAPAFRPFTTTLTKRVTRKYVDAYRHLDTEYQIGTATVMQRSTQLTDDEDPCEPTRIMMLVEIKLENRDHSLPLVSNADIKQALRDTFTHWGCGHEHDCCGCWNTCVTDVVPLLRSDENPTTQWVVIQSSSRNY